MATKRSKMTINNRYTQSLKVPCENDNLFIGSPKYHSYLLSKAHNGLPKIQSNLSVQFNSDELDGIILSGYFTKGFDIKKAGSCEFNIYQMSNDGTEIPTLLLTVSGIEQNDKFVKTVASTDIPSVYLDGEYSLMIEMTITRRSKKYKVIKYVNHLGIYDSFVQLKKKVNFINLTKEDK